MELTLGRILLEDGKGNYSIAKFTKDKLNLEPSKSRENKIKPSTLENPKYSGKYKTQNPPIGTSYPPIGKPYKKNKEYFAQICLNQLIEFSNGLISEEKEDYVLLKEIQTEDLGKKWGLSAEVYYMKNRGD